MVAVECMFTWYWLEDLYARENIAFVLGHALYMRAIHGDKAKNDRINAQKIAALPALATCRNAASVSFLSGLRSA